MYRSHPQSSTNRSHRRAAARTRLFVACLGLLSLIGSIRNLHAAVGANNVTANFNAGTLLLTGDTYNNDISLTVQGGFLRITGQNGTTVNGLAVYSVAYNGALSMTADLRGGDDTLTITQATVNISTLQFGPGDDWLFVTNRATVAINLFDGGVGRERIQVSNSSFRVKTFQNFP